MSNPRQGRIALVTNTQISESLVRRKRSGKRPWLILVAAIGLVTLPVLPLKFLGIPGPDFSNVTDLGKAVFKRIKGTIPGKVDSSKEENGQLHEAAFDSADVELLDKTAQTLLRRVSDTPDNPSLHNRLGLTFLELGENHSAVTHFEEAVKLSKAKISKLRAKANAARKQNNITAAAEYITEISALDIQLTAAHSSLARVYERLGKSEKVIFHLNELDREVKLARTFPASKGSQGKEGASGEKEKSGGESRLNATTASILARANAYKEAGRLQEAIREYNRLIHLAPGLAIGHYELGLTAFAAHNFWLSEKELKEASKLNPNSATTLNALGDVYSQTGRVEEAKDAYLKSMALNPEASSAAFSLGNIYASKGKYAEARDAFHKAVAVDPQSAYAHNNLATMCSLTGDYQNAADEFRTAINYAPNMASAHYGLGLALMNMKQYRECIPHFKRALFLNPSMVDAHNKIEIAQRKSKSL